MDKLVIFIILLQPDDVSFVLNESSQINMFTTVLVLLFLFKLRFPRGTSFTATLKRRYGQRTLVEFRRFEKNRIKFNHCQLDVKFLNVCKSYNVLPRFLHFKLYRKELTSSKLYKSWQFKLLNLELKSKQRQIRKLDRLIEQNQLYLKNHLSIFD